jgi:hypothetical protein
MIQRFQAALVPARGVGDTAPPAHPFPARSTARGLPRGCAGIPIKANPPIKVSRIRQSARWGLDRRCFRRRKVLVGLRRRPVRFALKPARLSKIVTRSVAAAEIVNFGYAYIYLS